MDGVISLARVPDDRVVRVGENEKIKESGPADNLAGSRWSTGLGMVGAMRPPPRGIFIIGKGKEHIKEIVDILRIIKIFAVFE